VRILTIHAAKGLEAEVVVLMGANHSDAGADKAGVLCDWPQDAPAPVHFSVFGKKAERGVARARFFEQEQKFREQEIWNLLYVAATRARQLLIISGTHTGRDEHNGVKPDSWYQQLLSVDEFSPEPRQSSATASGDQFSLSLFLPPALANPNVITEQDNDLTLEGKRLHALMERLTARSEWPVVVPAASVAARWLRCTEPEARVVCEQAARILSSDELQRFFNPADYQSAHNELELVHEGDWLRIDRLVLFKDALWVLDYKRQVLAQQQTDYWQQLARYRAACGALFPGKPVHSALITVDGRLWPSEDNTPV
jgi:ATP-dependent helicase/nuclease subunit A